MKFSKVEAMRIPGGPVKKIRHSGTVLWQTHIARYVSFGDSIAAGHTINDQWEADYGTDSQYGVNGNNETDIVPGSYTALIRADLVERVGGRVLATSFARSGDRVDDLMDKLNHAVVRTTLSKADYVTVCIGANDVLEPALSHLEEYISAGDSALAEIAAIVEGNLAVLADDTAAAGYTALFNALAEINPKAQYVFTTIYNPYKYLWLEEGQDGFFGPLLNTIPQMTILGFEVDELIKDGLLGIDAVQTLFDRVNGLCDWAEKYVTALNTVLRNKISSYQATNPNFLLADTKALWDAVPDRPVSAQKHYNDLVNVEYTRGYDITKIDWGLLWVGSNAADFWRDLATKYVSASGLDIGGMTNELVELIVEKVIQADVDPHPEEYGHHALFCSFADAFGWSALPRRTITFHANGGTGTMDTQTVVALDGYTAYANIGANAFNPGAEGYYFTGWNTKADGSGTAYANGQYVGLDGDLTLYAQWSNIYKVTVRHSEDSTYHGSGDTGPMECYALWIDGVEQADLGAFSNDARVYNLPYGTPMGVIVETKSGAGRSYITWNGNKVKGNSNRETYDFQVKSHMEIHFEWNYWLDATIPPEQSYWNCYITTQ